MRFRRTLITCRIFIVRSDKLFFTHLGLTRVLLLMRKTVWVNLELNSRDVILLTRTNPQFILLLNKCELIFFRAPWTLWYLVISTTYLYVNLSTWLKVHGGGGLQGRGKDLSCESEGETFSTFSYLLGFSSFILKMVVKSVFDFNSNRFFIYYLFNHIWSIYEFNFITTPTKQFALFAPEIFFFRGSWGPCRVDTKSISHVLIKSRGEI